MNEAETRAELIDPALKAAGWGDVPESRIGREVIAPGRLQGSGHRARSDIADYVLVYRNQKLAVIEAKRKDLPDTEGLGQAKRYAERLQTRFAYATNGVGIYRVDMDTGEEGYVDAYATPQEMWDATFGTAQDQPALWRDRFAAIPFEDKSGQWKARYYQHNAITRTLEAIGQGRDRILLTLATGTGKTAIAFQIAWKLFKARWNLTDWRDGLEPGEEPKRRPRILFLADRNILADQAFNSFSAFPEDALIRIAPDDIAKKGKVPKNGSIFFTIFQTFMTGTDENGDPSPYFGDYPPDFFDFIVIDECHRGGASDESTWRGIMEYFAPAVQLGLTATPRRKDNVDTYAYFGESVYTYSLKQGINDGYLTPFRVKQISTTIDSYVYTDDDEVLEGEIQEGKSYEENDFNRIIEIMEREEKRVRILMDHIDQRQKTLIFCADQPHALAIRDLVNQLKTSTDPNYCVRVTANDGAIGEQFLRAFQDNEKTIPTVLTTSRKLSTGVDARNVRNIVLLRPIKSMVEFKQIIGRGTRLFEGKDYFTIYDFVKAHKHFSDREWDGDPLPEPCATCGQIPCVCEEGEPEPCAVCGQRPCVCEIEPPEPCPVCGASPCICETPPCPKCGQKPCVCNRKVKVKLADGKARAIQHMVATSFWSPDGKPISAAEFIQQLYGALPDLFANEDELREIWSRPDTRRKLLDGLGERGYAKDQLVDLSRMIEAEQSDLFDVLAYIAFACAPISRQQRVEAHRATIHKLYADPQREFLDFVLAHYMEQGVDELDQDKLPHLLRLHYRDIPDAVAILGTIPEIRDLFVGFQKHLYEPEEVA